MQDWIIISRGKKPNTHQELFKKIKYIHWSQIQAVGWFQHRMKLIWAGQIGFLPSVFFTQPGLDSFTQVFSFTCCWQKYQNPSWAYITADKSW